MTSSAKWARSWVMAGGEDVLGLQMLQALLFHLIGIASVANISGNVYFLPESQFIFGLQ